MYEQNLGGSATSLDTALSMGTHESQSLFWERHVGLGKPFWKWATPLLKDKFPDQFSDLSVDDVYGAVNAVSPSLIRVEADELTYPLHVIMRYGIEKDVIGGNLEVKDIPARWKSDMKSMLDVDVPDDAKGCLQDIHWASLAFGYFPTYLIGSATAAQLAHYCAQDIENMDEMIEKGEFAEIKQWLTDKVHRHGKRYKSLDALLEDQIGEKLNPKYFIDYLTNKYSELYKL
jgi:carboxypeptidase Taq